MREGKVAALVLGERSAIHVHICSHHRAFKFEEGAQPFAVGQRLEGLTVEPDVFPRFSIPVLPGELRDRVRQGNSDRFRWLSCLAEELPIVIKRHRAMRGTRTPCLCESPKGTDGKRRAGAKRRLEKPATRKTILRIGKFHSRALALHREMEIDARDGV